MKKLLRVLILFLFGLPAFGQANWSDTAFLHRSGCSIVDGSGNAIRLEGVNLGSWLMWEGWIWGGGYTAEKTIYTKISNKVGQAAADQFTDSIHQLYITRKDFELLAEQCYNVVRIPFNHNILEDDTNPFVYKQEGWNLLDSALAWCEDNNIYAVLDLHGAPGGQSNFFIADPDTPNLWNSSQNQLRTAALWQAIADRYKNRGIVAGYDLLNEPNAPDDETLVNFYDVLIDSIRAVDNNHMLFIEGKTSSTDFTIFSSLPDPNMVFAFHFYTWFVFNIPNALNEFRQLSEDFNVPVWCGEWGENNYAQLTTTLDNFKLPSNQFSGEAFWTWKKHVSGSDYPFYLGVDASTMWDKSIKWIGNGFAPQPTAAEMQQGIAEFLHNIKLENCLFNDTMNNVLSSCITAGLEEKDPMLLDIYPNPATNFVQVILPENTDTTERSLLIYNSAGAVAGSFSGIGNEAVFTLETSGFVSGLYYLTLVTGEGIYRAKIVVSH